MLNRSKSPLKLNLIDADANEKNIIDKSPINSKINIIDKSPISSKTLN